MEVIYPTNEQEIPENIKGTSFEIIIRSHNFKEHYSLFEKARILMIKCMDARVRLDIPDGIGYVMRSAGANVSNLGFYLNFAVAIGKIKEIAIIGHTDCAMVQLSNNPDLIAKQFAETFGWSLQHAKNYINDNYALYSISNESEFTFQEAEMLNRRFEQQGVITLPFMFDVETHLLGIIIE